MPHPSLFIPALAPSLNGDKGLMRMHHRTYARVRDAWVWMVKEAMRQPSCARDLPGERAPISEPCTVEIVRWHTGVPLDLDNLVASAKLPLDAMCRAGLLVDDNPEIITSLKVRQCRVPHKKDVRTEITLSW